MKKILSVVCGLLIAASFMSCEKKGAIEGSINELALHDLKIFKEAYQSKENGEFIKTKFPGSVYLGWKE